MKCRNQSIPNYKVGEVVASRCEESNFENDYHFLGSVSENEDISEWVASLKICKDENFIGEFLFKIDSGACVTCMPSECYTSEMGQLNKST